MLVRQCGFPVNEVTAEVSEEWQGLCSIVAQTKITQDK